MTELLIAFCVWNMLIFLSYGKDKHSARNHKRRIRESVLITPAFFLGSLGAMLGMIVFNHKTSKTKFRTLIPLSFLENILILYIIRIN